MSDKQQQRKAPNGTAGNGVSQGSDQGQSAPPTKRRRIALACSACRLRKSRCNGAHPRCSLCEQMGFECSYEALESAANVVVPRSSMAAFEERLHYLEGRVKVHDAILSSAPAPKTDVVLPNSSLTQAPSKNVVLQEEPREETVTDGMAITFVSEDDSGFFGATSNIAFMRHVKRAMEAMGRGDIHTPTMISDVHHIDNGLVSVSRPASPPNITSPETTFRDTGGDIRCLPPDDETRELLRRYFSNTGLLFPFIDESAFYETYEAMRSGAVPRAGRTWLGLFNMVLAMASSTWADPKSAASVRRRQSDVFYQRARELCKKQIFRGASLETVQYLLLMGQYLQGTQKSVQTWAMHGLAVKAAYSIGLHSSNVNTRYPHIVQEMRRRTWYGCVVLDRSLSMTFGRPHSIPEDHIRLPLPTPFVDDPVPKNGITGVSVSGVIFFAETIKLYQVQTRVISALYEQNLGCAQPLSDIQITTEVFRLEQELNLWRRCVASPLCIRSSDTVLWREDAACEERLNIVLTLRYLNLQTLLHRPFVAKALNVRTAWGRGSESTASAERLATGSIQTCIKSAEEIISIVHTVIIAKRAHALLGAWWFSLYYVFGAALTIFGTLLISPSLAATAASLPGRLEEGCASIKKASEALRQLDDDNQVVARCADFLSEISRLLENWRSNSTSTDVHNGRVLHHQEAFQAGEYSLASFPGMDLDMSQVGSDALFINDFALDDLEMGQFFLPDDFLHRPNPGKNRPTS